MKATGIVKGKKSTWESRAKNRIKNRKWLGYSSNIARRILAAIEEKKEVGEFNQKILASKTGVKPQYISKILRGNENLSLKTIAKFSEVLDVELISFPDYRYNANSELSFFAASIYTERNFTVMLNSLNSIRYSDLGVIYNKTGNSFSESFRTNGIDNLYLGRTLELGKVIA